MMNMFILLPMILSQLLRFFKKSKEQTKRKLLSHSGLEFSLAWISLRNGITSRKRSSWCGPPLLLEGRNTRFPQLRKSSDRAKG